LGLRDVESDRSRWRTHIDDAFFIEWHIATIRAQDVREWTRELIKKNVTPGQGHKKTKGKRISHETAKNALNLLRVALEAAVQENHLPENPARGVRLPKKPPRTHEPWTYLLPEEQTALLACDRIPLEGRCLIAFALGTGIRESEQWALKLHDIDLARNMITVRFGSHGKPRKNGKIYHIPILPLARWALETWLPILAKRPNPFGVLWPTSTGLRRPSGKAPVEWPEWLALAGIFAERRHDRQGVRWHDLRHTCASSLVAGWWGDPWTLEQVAAQLGHASRDSTERYAHLAPGALLAPAARLDLSRIYPPGLSTTQLSGGNPSAPPAGIGPATFGLGNNLEGARQTLDKCTKRQPKTAPFQPALRRCRGRVEATGGDMRGRDGSRVEATVRPWLDTVHVV